jgi:transposase
MHEGRLIFAQLMDFIPKRDFDDSVNRYHGNYRVRDFSCRDQFLAMAFAQLTYRESLRDIETCLRALEPKLYHAGFHGKISRSTLGDANKRRDWHIWADFAQVLIRRARALYAKDDFGVALKQAAYALDSTTIDLCLALFPWARFRRHKGAVKLHTLIDLRGNIPCFIRITHGKTADVTVLDRLPIEPGAFYMMDKGYIDFGRLYAFTRQMAFFVTRAKKNLVYYRRESRVVDKSTGLRSDQTIILQGLKTSHLYPAPLRRVAYYDAEHNRRLVFLTNNFELSALTIAQLYRCRWRVELFFKWIKQNLRIKKFYGNSVNALKTQVWIVVSVYVLVAILRKELKLDRNLTEILQILSVTPFEKIPICQALSTSAVPNLETTCRNQLSLFDL